MKKMFFVFLGCILLVFVFALPMQAQVDWGMNYATNVGLGTAEIRTVAVNIIRTLLGLLSIIALIIILIGGFRWMTSAGNEDNVAAAKKTIAAGIIGLIIIFFAYAIVSFVMNTVGNSLTNGSSGYNGIREGGDIDDPGSREVDPRELPPEADPGN